MTVIQGDSHLDRYQYSEENRDIIKQEKLLPPGVLSRIQANYPQYSGLCETKSFLFKVGSNYSGLEGFRKVCQILEENDIVLEKIKEREFYIEVYRFLATSHSLNIINWDDYQTDSVYQLVLPQPGMADPEATKAYVAAKTAEERAKIVADYTEKTNPHDGNQQLNKPWFENEDGEVEFLDSLSVPTASVMLRFAVTKICSCRRILPSCIAIYVSIKRSPIF